jgi:hypothetical protein
MELLFFYKITKHGNRWYDVKLMAIERPIKGDPFFRTIHEVSLFMFKKKNEYHLMKFGEAQHLSRNGVIFYDSDSEEHAKGLMLQDGYKQITGKQYSRLYQWVQKQYSSNKSSLMF